MPRSFVLSCDLSRLNVERPIGAAVYACFVLDLVRRSGEAQVVGPDRAREADVILSLDGRFRAGSGQRTVTAVLDLGHLVERSGYGFGQWLTQNWRVASAARRSDHLLAPSEAVAFGLDRYLGTPSGRVTVLPPLPRPCFRRPTRDQVAELRRDLGLPERYFLFLGSRARRKNLALLAAAWRAAAPSLGPDVALVLAGAPGSGGVPGARDLGLVPLERLPALLAGAVAWLNPSLYEGAGIGAMEAMACGTPAIVAGTGAQARTVGSAGLVLDPHDAGQWAEALTAMAGHAQLRARLASGSLKSAAELRAAAPGWPELRSALVGA